MDYDEAQKVKRRHRNVEPGIYNEERLYEEPIPSTSIQSHPPCQSTSDSWSDLSSDSIAQSQSPAIAEIAVEVPALDATESNLADSIAQSTNSSTSSVEFRSPNCLALLPYVPPCGIFQNLHSIQQAVDVKPEPVAVFSTSNASEVENVLRNACASTSRGANANARPIQGRNRYENVTEEVRYYGAEPIVMTYTRFAMPVAVTVDGLIKKEGDVISNNIPFRETVSY